MALVRMHSKPCLFYLRRWEASGTASLTNVSTAYHQKVAKDRATKEGIVVNPPELGNLPGQGEVTYASQVQDVRIPYTTREDTYNYYEERNYVNDVNREHTEVLETYDHDGKAERPIVMAKVKLATSTTKQVTATTT